jgi:TetR/AcrR family fatty acid metabolism transcriptional regulator
MKNKSKDVRARIIHNALKIFANEGFFRTTVEDIAHASGVAKGTVYLYFKDKSSLYVNVIDEHFITGIAYLKAILVEHLSNREKLYRIADEWIDSMIQVESSFFMFTMENLNLSRKILKVVKPIMNTRLQELVDILAKIIESGIRAGEFRKLDARITALHFLNTIRTGYYMSFFIPELKTGKKILLSLFFDGIKKQKRNG